MKSHNLNIKICIPTHGREDAKFQRTITHIPEELHSIVYFFTCETRVDKLRDAVPAGCNIVPVPKELGEYGIAGKRQFIVEWANSNNFKKIWQIDDNTTIQQVIGRYDTERSTLQIITMPHEKLEGYLHELEDKLENYVVAGTLNRSGTYMGRRDFSFENCKADIENNRVYTSMGMRTDILVENDIRFDHLQRKFSDPSLSLMEDYSLLIQCLQSGLKTLQIGNWCFDKVSFSGNGGCASERNIESQRNVCEKMLEAFPGFVTIVKASDKTKAKTVKWNIRISWKKLSDAIKNEEKRKLIQAEEW